MDLTEYAIILCSQSHVHLRGCRWGTKKIFSVKIVGRISYMLSSSYSDGFIYRILKDFDQGIKDDPTNLELNKTVAEKKKSLIRELNTYIALRKTFSSTISSKAELFEGGSQAGTATNQAYRVASSCRRHVAYWHRNCCHS